MNYFEKMQFLKENTFHSKKSIFNKRDILICLLSIIIGISVGYLAQALKLIINFVTNFFYFGKFSFELALPENNHLGYYAFFIPIIGGFIVGLIARFINPSVYGHGIPETMEKILINESLIQKRMLFLKPASAAISVGTGGPFGEEGPIIATGATLGSAFGQLIKMSSEERKILLASGVAGAVSAAFGSPFGGIFLAIELMLFEFKPRSLVPAALSVIAAEFIRMKFVGDNLAFTMSLVSLPTASMDIICYFVIGIFIGVISVGMTHSVHYCESIFEKLPIHWMWWPALGGIGVGAIGVIEPKILGAGYETISSILNGNVIGHFAASLFILKFLAWLIGVSSRTTAGTLAPLFMIGGCLGVTLSGLISYLFPFIQLDPKIAAMVGMASLFAGVTRAFLASVFITLEATHQFWAAIPVLTGCVAAYLISLFLMQHSILTYSLVKKGIIIPNEQSNVTVNDHQKTDNKK